MQSAKLHCHDNPLCFFISSSSLPVSIDPQANFHYLLTVAVIVTYSLPSQFSLDISNQFSPHFCSWSSIDSFDILFLVLSEGSGWRACETVYKIMTSTVVYSSVLGLLIHSTVIC